MGHPTGLFVLFFTEMWERFSYYGMRALLVLYLTTATTGDGALAGLGWGKKRAFALYGTYTMLVYVASIPGGLLADKVFGQKRAVLYGGLILCVGHLVLALPGISAFYAGLGLIIAGVGLLKPNISTMVGGLYEQGDDRRDKGFNIFYMGINIGALLAGVIVGTIGETKGWHYGFGLAGIGMLFGQAVYMWGQKHLEGVGDRPSKSNSKDVSAAAQKPMSKIEKDRTLVLFLAFFIVIIFWGAFEQAGGLLNVYAKEKTDLVWGFKATWFQSLNPLYIILFAIPVANFWILMKKKGKESSSLFKMAVGTIIMGWGFLFMVFAANQNLDGEKAWMGWLVLAYLFHTVGELCASPVALSFITKLAPVKWASFMMGAYFAATGLGNKVAGKIGEESVHLGEKPIFIGVAVFCTVFGLMVIFFLRPLKRLTHNAEDQKIATAH